MKVCNLLPGSNESFTVEKYKHFLNKPYSKINLFVCLKTHFFSLVEDKYNALENNNNESKEKHELAITNDEIFKADESYLKRLEENLTDITNNPITVEDNNERATYLTEKSAQGTSFEDDSYTLFTSPSRQNIFNIICQSCLKSFPANVIEAHADACTDEHKPMNILCHSSVIEIESDDNGSIVFAGSWSSEKGTSIYVLENPYECREMLKKVVTDCGIDINKKPISITVFHGSYFNDFYSHFRKHWIKKKTVASDSKLSLLVKMLLMRVVFQWDFIQVGWVLRTSFLAVPKCCSFH